MNTQFNSYRRLNMLLQQCKRFKADLGGICINHSVPINDMLHDRITEVRFFFRHKDVVHYWCISLGRIQYHGNEPFSHDDDERHLWIKQGYSLLQQYVRSQGFDPIEMAFSHHKDLIIQTGDHWPLAFNKDGGYMLNPLLEQDHA